MYSEPFKKALNLIKEYMNHLAQERNISAEYLQFKFHPDGTGWIETIEAKPTVLISFDSIDEIERNINQNSIQSSKIEQS